MSATHWGVFFTVMTLLGAIFAATISGAAMALATIVVLVFQVAAIGCFLAGSRKRL